MHSCEQQSLTWSRWLLLVFLCFHVSCILFIWCAYDICLSFINDSGIVAGGGGQGTIAPPPRILACQNIFILLENFRPKVQNLALKIRNFVSIWVSKNCNFLPPTFINSWCRCSMRLVCKQMEGRQKQQCLHRFPTMDCFSLLQKTGLLDYWSCCLLSVVSHSHIVIIPAWSLIDLFAKLPNLNKTHTVVTVCWRVFDFEQLKCGIMYHLHLQIQLLAIFLCWTGWHIKSGA